MIRRYLQIPSVLWRFKPASCTAVRHVINSSVHPLFICWLNYRLSCLWDVMSPSGSDMLQCIHDSSAVLHSAVCAQDHSVFLLCLSLLELICTIVCDVSVMLDRTKVNRGITVTVISVAWLSYCVCLLCLLKAKYDNCVAVSRVR